MKTPRTIFVLITVISLLMTNLATAQARRPVPSGHAGTGHAIGSNLPCGTDPTLVGCWQMDENGGTVLLDGSSYCE